MAIPGVALYFALTGAKGLGGLPPEVWSFPLSRDVRAGDVLAAVGVAVRTTRVASLRRSGRCRYDTSTSGAAG